MRRPARPSQVVPGWYGELRAIIRDKIGFVLQPKPSPALRALFESRVRARGPNSTQAVLAHLRRADPSDPDLMALINVVTIKKTHFFRDRAQFEGLREWMVSRRGGPRPVSIWCAGCSTGEEPYSIAMLAHTERLDVEILGSDINTDALATARRGEYTRLTLGEIPPEFKSRYLHTQERGLRVAPEIKKMVRFTRHNLLDPAYPSPVSSGMWDIVLCRNVLIYFEASTVERVAGHIHNALRREGRLLLGAGESLHGRKADYDLVRLGRSFAYRPAPLGSRPQAGVLGERVERLADQSDPAHDVAELAQTVAEAARSGELSSESEPATYSESDPTPTNAGSAEERTALLHQFRRGDTEKRTHTLERLRNAVERTPENGLGWLTLGNALLEMGELTEALEAYQTGQALMPLSPEAHYLMGLVHKKTGARGPAIQALRRALFLEPGFWPAAFHLAGLYQQEGMVREAIGEYRNALRALSDAKTATPRFESGLAGDDYHGHFRNEVRATCEARLKQLGGTP